MLVQFNDTSEFPSMQENSEISQHRAKFPMCAVTQSAPGVSEIEIRDQDITS